MTDAWTRGQQARVAIDELGIGRRPMLRALGGGVIAGAFGGFGLTREGGATGRPRQRSLSELLAAQGSTADFNPPFPDYLGGSTNADHPPIRFSYTDYAGVLAKYLAAHEGITIGTKVTGSVIERPLADGRAELKIVLRATRALSWATVYPGDDECEALEEEHDASCFAYSPMLFGYRPAELIANRSLRPALAESVYKFVVINTAPGAPLPDLGLYFYGDLAPGQEPVSTHFLDLATGPLRAASGYSEGTPGFMKGEQVAVNLTNPDCDASCYPVETVDLRPLRRGRHGGFFQGEARHGGKQRKRGHAHQGGNKSRKRGR